jgi:urea transport system permease protein
MSAVGLAIIFGLMGVINLAQGELIMIGAYVTFCVQQFLKAVTPSWVDYYPILAIPVVFAVTALIGVIIEFTVIRHLYRRPLMTLLATWAISLLLINVVRVTFGTQNLQFLTPWYLTGGVRLVGDFLVTWNHLFAIGFAVFAFIATSALLRWTDLGLFIRAVTQNRPMAGCVGVATRRIDMAAFGFGAGLAGLGGLALSPIYNVNPSMGTGFIIDSFMVVVLGGVGSLLGTAIASFGVGLVNVGIEPFYGAVAAKVIALMLIIAIIQWRPEGLVAARGRR